MNAQNPTARALTTAARLRLAHHGLTCDFCGTGTAELRDLPTDLAEVIICAACAHPADWHRATLAQRAAEVAA